VWGVGGVWGGGGGGVGANYYGRERVTNIAYISKFIYSTIISGIPKVSEDNRNNFCTAN